MSRVNNNMANKANNNGGFKNGQYGVVSLTPESFNTYLSKSASANKQRSATAGDFVVAFIRSTCPFCKRLQPIYNEASKATVIPLLSFDVNQLTPVDEKQLRTEYDIKTFPTLIYFRDSMPLSKHHFKNDESKNASVGTIVEWVDHPEDSQLGELYQEEEEEVEEHEVLQGPDGEEVDVEEVNEDEEPNPALGPNKLGANDYGVKKLNTKTLKEEMKKVDEMVLAFVMNGCPHCENMRDAYNTAASNSKVPMHSMEVKGAGDLPEKLGIQGFPSIVKISNYNGNRTAESLHAFANQNTAA